VRAVSSVLPAPLLDLTLAGQSSPRARYPPTSGGRAARRASPAASARQAGVASAPYARPRSPS